MASFTMNEHEYFKAIEENTIVQIYCCEFCYVIDPAYKTVDRIRHLEWTDMILTLIDKSKFIRYRQWVMMGNGCCMLE